MPLRDPRRLLVVVVGTLLLGRADVAAADAARDLREAFQPLRLAAGARWEKEVTSALPPGVVIEAQPFHDLIRRFGAPADEVFDRREAVLRGLPGPPPLAVADALRSGLKVVDAETDDLHERVAAAEARYAEVWNLEWDVAGEKERQTRKLAAVVIPLCRHLLAREATTLNLAAEVLGRLEGAEGTAWLSRMTGDPSPSVRGVAVDALARVGGPEALAALGRVAATDPEAPLRLEALGATLAWKMAEAKAGVLGALADAAWEVRALAVAACARGRLVEAVPALVEALSREEGRLRQDIDDALFALVGVRMYGDAGLWRKWLEENREQVAARAAAAAAEGAGELVLGPPETWEPPAESSAEDAKGSTSAFYGIRTPSRRVVFVVDISRSMQDAAQEKPPSEGGPKDPWHEPKGTSKLAIAKWQLHRAIAALPADALFDVIVYSESYRLWLPAMSEATPKAKAKAHDFVDGVVANGTTNVADSLERAFELAGAFPVLRRGKTPRASLAADTIFLLSDGDPNRGRLTDLPALEEDLVRRARAHRIVVHTVGIGEVAGSSFLASLARRTTGRYVGFR